MIETHAIRLRGPWECQTHDGPSRRVHMPAALVAVIDGEHQGRLVCRRRFGCPTCLDPHERVWLVIERPAFSGEAHLNNEPLGRIHITHQIIDFDITNRLRERNDLTLDFDIAAPQAIDDLLFADVRLEIRG
jgi:hypothetical protein